MVRELILAQMGGEWSLNLPSKWDRYTRLSYAGEPYLWADGQNPRVDGVNWRH